MPPKAAAPVDRLTPRCAFLIDGDHDTLIARFENAILQDRTACAYRDADGVFSEVQGTPCISINAAGVKQARIKVTSAAVAADGVRSIAWHVLPGNFSSYDFGKGADVPQQQPSNAAPPSYAAPPAAAAANNEVFAELLRDQRRQNDRLQDPGRTIRVGGTTIHAIPLVLTHHDDGSTSAELSVAVKGHPVEFHPFMPVLYLKPCRTHLARPQDPRDPLVIYGLWSEMLDKRILALTGVAGTGFPPTSADHECLLPFTLRHNVSHHKQLLERLLFAALSAEARALKRAAAAAAAAAADVDDDDDDDVDDGDSDDDEVTVTAVKPAEDAPIHSAEVYRDLIAVGMELLIACLRFEHGPRAEALRVMVHDNLEQQPFFNYKAVLEEISAIIHAPKKKPHQQKRFPAARERQGQGAGKKRQVHKH